MSGFTKHQSTVFQEKSNRDFSKYIGKISNLLPLRYSFENIYALLEKYYTYELQMLIEGCEYYSIKDRKLLNVKGKSRHNIPEQITFLKDLKITKNVLSENFIAKHKTQFDEGQLKQNILNLDNERLPKVNRIKAKIENAKKKAQLVEPFFLDKLIGLYDRKTTSQKDKVYIFKELEKYYCYKTIQFFKKKVDTEYNKQLREMAFFHLQGYMHFVSLRRHKYMRVPSKNKKRREYLKKTYAYERFKIQSIPEELEYRISNSKEQKLKKYDFFISHSSVDFEEVQKLIHLLNGKKKDVYCDWINDTDYLKRNLVSNSTKKVIEKRLEQSKNIILVKSETSQNSKWVKYELNYFHSLNRTIYEIELNQLKQGIFEFEELKELWFYDENYSNIILN